MKRLVVVILVSAICGGLIDQATAGLISTEAVLAEKNTYGQTREQLQLLLNESAVKEQLQSHGIDVAKVRQRLANMTDAELAVMQEQLESLPAGAGEGTDPWHPANLAVGLLQGFVQIVIMALMLALLFAIIV